MSPTAADFSFPPEIWVYAKSITHDRNTDTYWKPSDNSKFQYRLCSGYGARRSLQYLHEDLLGRPNANWVEAKELTYIEQLTRPGFEGVEVPDESVLSLGGMLRCTTLDVHGEGDCEECFPRQIPWY